jgi:hypothetical protein
MTCELMIWDLKHAHVLVLDLFECVFNGKNVTLPPQVVCAIV